MPENSYHCKPGLFMVEPGQLFVRELHVNELTAGTINSFLSTASECVIGVSATYGSKRTLSAIAISTRSVVLVIRISSKGNRNTHNINLLRARILCNAKLKKLSFDAERVACGLLNDHKLHISHLVDVQSLTAAETRWSNAALLKALGHESGDDREKILEVFNGEDKANNELRRAALRSWATWRVVTLPNWSNTIKIQTGIIDTKKLEAEVLASLGSLVRNLDRLRAMKPTKVKNDISQKFTTKKGDVNMELTRFKTRARFSENQRIVVHAPRHDNETSTIRARLQKVNGRQIVVALQQKIPSSAKQINMYTFGREDPTSAEQERTEVVLQVLQRTQKFFSLALARAIFLEGNTDALIPHNPLTSNDIVSPACNQDRPLNPSQMQAVKRILSPLLQHFVVVVQGPPGTGKTTVIASTVKSLMGGMTESNRSVWLIAQSNVAVKNIAEKLASTDFWDFKLLVSKDFHFDWHEHLYHRIESNIIRSDEFADQLVGTDRLLAGSRVILCTLSMFSHPRLSPSGFTSLVPVETVIIDEASQIEIGDYVPVISKFGKTIRKLVFIGDDKQLPPYGQEEVKELRSIFEVKRFRKNIVFLDTQYRMPVPIGQFLSRQMYHGRLKSVHKITDKSCCRLVDVPRGKESLAGSSFKNVEEAAAVIRIAKHMHKTKKCYRIITPYDGQRGLIEDLLKRERLPWEDKCFCVDSFQGNEEDHIIISIVRSEKVGFLNNRRRSNVMLSRCKKSMVICTSRQFLTGKAADTLLGALEKRLGPDAWTDVRELVSESE
ncbi:hypothetical protein NM688_g8981 [Phlebia brevispora]|uniref:Uncharacterized protein n=1 Tax=Phlebia brevispora TaxID=194682 RepID=A0ACC1RMQ9_9APHY|nr:hypothetical protein NM688_g8981 [Phlebia brevispora]